MLLTLLDAIATTAAATTNAAIAAVPVVRASIAAGTASICDAVGGAVGSICGFVSTIIER